MSSSDLRVRTPMAYAIRRPARPPFGGGHLLFDMGSPAGTTRNPQPAARQPINQTTC